MDIENSSIKIIGIASFLSCKNLRFISFPESLKEICGDALNSCYELERVIFPLDSKLMKNGYRAFSNCYKLDIFDFPSMLEIIENEAFDETNIEVFNLIHTKIREIGQNVNGNKGKETIFSLPKTVSLKIIENFSCYHVYIDDEHPILKRDIKGNYITFKIFFSANKKLRHVFIWRGIEKIA